MGASVCVIADTFERRSGIPDLLTSLGASVHVERLPVGDYDVGGQTLVERKSVLDFHSSLLTGRLWIQLGALRRTARYPFVLLEGVDIDDGPMTPDAIRGACISALRLSIRVLQSKNPEDSALWLFRLAAQCQRRETQFQRRGLKHS